MNIDVAFRQAHRRAFTLLLFLCIGTISRPASAQMFRSYELLRAHYEANGDIVRVDDRIDPDRSVHHSSIVPRALPPWRYRAEVFRPRGTTGLSTWNGGTGNWSDGTMWTPSGAPNDATADVFVDGGNATNSMVNIDAGFTVGRLTIDSGDAVSLLDNRVFIITDSGGFAGAGSLVNNGTFNLSSIGDGTDLRVNSATNGNVTVSGSGAITGSNTQANRIFGVNGNDLLTIGANQTVNGSLQFGVNLLRFVNNGLIDANTSGGISVDPTDNVGDAVNNGTMRASNGSTLTLQAGNYTNHSTISALAGSTVNLVNARIIGGTITTADLTGTGGVIQSGGDASLDGVTNTGYVAVPDNRVLRLLNTITNNGVIALNSGGNSSDLRLGNDVLLTGTGSVTSNGLFANRIFGAAGTERLTIDTSAVVQGAMQFGVNAMKFTNKGLIDANTNGGTLSIDPTDASGDAVNNATMRASNGGTLQLSFGIYTNTGTISALTNSTVSLVNGATISGGTITTTNTSGTGGVIQGFNATLTNVTNTGYVNIPDNNILSLTGTFTNNGVVNLNSVGNTTTLRINGDVTMSGSGTITTSNPQANVINSQNGTERLTIGSGITIQGSFNLGQNSLKFTNNGIINANLVAGATIDPTDTAGDAVNNGTIEATNGSTLSLTLGNYTNTNGTIAALGAGSTISLANGATITGGVLNTTDTTGTKGQVISGNDATLTNVTNNGYLALPDNRTLRLSGTLTNNGVLAMNSAGNSTDLRLIGDVTINGTGSFTTSNATQNRIFGNSGGETLTIGSGVTLGGSYSLGINQTKLINNGTIDANQSNGVSVDPSDGAMDATNNGIMQASNGATLTLQTGTYTNIGTIRALNNSAVNLVNGALVVGGTLTTSGTGVVQTGNDASLKGVTNTGLLNVPDNTTLRLFDTLTNNGTLMMSSAGNTTNLRIGTDLTLSGTGMLTTTNTQANHILGVGGTERLTISSGYTLSGSLNLGVDAMRFTNNGLINSNQSAGMSIDPTNAMGDAVNNGTIEATNGSTLTLAFGNYTNTNGIIQALDNSAVNLRDGALIVGGTLTTAGSGVIQTINDASVQDVTNTGLLNVPDNTTLRIFGTINNTGTIKLSSGGNTTDLRIGNDVTLSGTGSITTTNTQANRILGVGGNERLTISSGYTLSGSMNLGVNAMKFTNNGLINSNQSAGMSIDPSNAVGDAVNTGTIEATNASTLTLLFGNYTNTNGTIQALGAGSAVNLRDGAIITGGTLTTTDLSGSNGVIQSINDAELQNLTNNGFLNIVDNTRLRLFGTITDNGVIQMNSGGNITELRIDGDVTLSGTGTLRGSNTQANHVLGLSTGNETLTNGTMHTISGTMQLGLNSMNLINDGVINSNQSGGIVIDPTSTAVNDATGIFRASSGATLSLTNGTYTNNGTYEALDGSTLQMNGGATLTNYDSGTMTMTGGTYRAVSTGSQATLNLNIGQIANNAATIILDGAATIIHTSDNSTDALTPFNNNTAAGVFQITNGRNFDRTFAFNNAGTVIVGPMSLFTTVQFDLSGTLTGAGTLTDSGPFNWTAGTQSGTGITNANGALNITTAANKFLDARTINAAATTTWSGGDNISAGNGAIFNNLAAAIFNAQTTQMISFSGIGTAATFNNAGTFNKTGNGTTTSINAVFNNSGTANINSGTLALLDGGTDSGSFVDASGAALTFNGGAHELTGVSSTSGAGAVNFSLGTVTFDSGAVYNLSGLTTINGGTVNFNNSASAAATVLSAGTLSGSGSYSASGNFGWSGGTMSGSGTTNADGGLTMNGGSKTLVSRTLNNNGAATWSAGNVASGLGAIFNNPSGRTFDNSFDGSFLFNQGGTRTTFSNGGSFTKSAGSGTTLIEATYNNSGTTTGSSGTLELAGGGMNTGSFSIASNSKIQIQLNDYTIASGATISGAGTFEMTSANTTFNGTSSDSAAFLIDGGTATFAGTTSTSGAVTLSSGTLTGSGTLTDTGAFTWSGGTMSGAGITNANNGLTMNGNTKTFTGRTLNNNGSATWSAGNFSAGAGAIFNNPLGSTFTDTADLNWLFNQGGTLTQFNNGGTFTKSGGSGTSTLEVNFSNTGTLNANSGTLAFSQGVQGTSGIVNIGSSGTLDLSGGALASSASTLNANGHLSLGSNNFNVATDYTNANFGSGNTFNPRANVTGTGGINATGNVNQTVTGDVTGGTTTTPSITFGNFHVGDAAVTKNYAINNIGSSGPSLRGAIQTSVNGGSINDSRLSGSGVTAANFGPLATGANTGNLTVAFNPSSAGALSSQAVHLINNFDNVQDQNVAITGAAYRLASASTHTPEPVSFGVVHIGDTPSQALSITNSATNDGFSEKLDGSFSGSTGGVTTTGSFSLLNPGSASTAMKVGIDTASAGNKNGTATIALTSNGSGTSGLGTTALSSQTVNVTGQVNYFADPVVIFKSGAATLTMQSPTLFKLDFGTVQQNSGLYMAAFGLQNFLHDATFQDSLGGTFDLTGISVFAVTGAGPFSGIGSGSALDPNVSFNSAMNIGTYTGKVNISPNSANASGTMNLNLIELDLQANIIPEPGTWALILAGAGLLLGMQLRRKRS